MNDGPVIAGCDPLPAGTTMTIGYHPTSRCVIIIFSHPSEERGMYWPISMDDAQRMSELLGKACELSFTQKPRLDS